MSALLRDPGLVLADRWQRGFPLSHRPFAEVALAHDLTEAETLASFRRLEARGYLSRIGAVVRPHSAGASTLAAIAVPEDRLDAVSRRVSRAAFVNHNYERQHAVNLWFVVTAPSEAALSDTLEEISRDTRLGVLDLRLLEPYHIDLGFGLSSGAKVAGGGRARRLATAGERTLLAALQDGLPLVAKPYSLAAARLGWSRSDVTSALANMIADGVISRFGCVLRHRELGYAANAMAVWDVDDGAAGGLGRSLAAQPGISLCYLRKRAPPQWPFNLYAMVHGMCESQVRSAIARASAACGLDRYPRDILFSRRCFLQRGARFGQARDRRAA